MSGVSLSSGTSSVVLATGTAASGTATSTTKNGNNIWRYVMIGGSLVAVAATVAAIRRYRRKRAAAAAPSRALIGERHLGGRIATDRPHYDNTLQHTSTNQTGHSDDMSDSASGGDAEPLTINHHNINPANVTNNVSNARDGNGNGSASRRRRQRRRAGSRGATSDDSDDDTKATNSNSNATNDMSVPPLNDDMSSTTLSSMGQHGHIITSASVVMPARRPSSSLLHGTNTSNDSKDEVMPSSDWDMRSVPSSTRSLSRSLLNGSDQQSQSTQAPMITRSTLLSSIAPTNTSSSLSSLSTPSVISGIAAVAPAVANSMINPVSMTASSHNSNDYTMISSRDQQLIMASSSPLPYLSARRDGHERNGVLMVALLLLIAVLLMLLDGRTAIISPLLGIYMRSLISRQSDKDDHPHITYAPYPASLPLPAPSLSSSSSSTPLSPSPVSLSSSSSLSSASQSSLPIVPVVSGAVIPLSSVIGTSAMAATLDGKTEANDHHTNHNHNHSHSTIVNGILKHHDDQNGHVNDGDIIPLPSPSAASSSSSSSMGVHRRRASGHASSSLLLSGAHQHDQHESQASSSSSSRNAIISSSSSSSQASGGRITSQADRERRHRQRSEQKAERNRRHHDDIREREWFQPVLSAPVIDSSPTIVTIEYDIACAWHHVVAQYWTKEAAFDAATYRESPDDEFAVFRHIAHWTRDSYDGADGSGMIDLRTKAGRSLGGKSMEQVTQENLTAELYYVVTDQLLHYSGRILTAREMRILNKLGAKGGLMGVPAGTTHLVQLEYSVVDPIARSFRLRSVNREFRKVIVATDEREYTPHPDKPDTHTRFTQRCQVGMSFLLRYLKSLGAGVLERKAKKNHEDFAIKLSRMTAAGVLR